MIMYVGLFGHSAVDFHVLMFFHVFFVLLTVCVVVFFSDILLIYSAAIAASLFNKLTYLVTYELDVCQQYNNANAAFVTSAEATTEGGRQKRWSKCPPIKTFGCSNPTCYYEKVKCRKNKCKWKLKCKSSSKNLCYRVCMG